MNRCLWILWLVTLGLAGPGHGEFTLEDNGTTLTILENGRTVLGYNYGRMDPPADSRADKNRYWRSSYIHPLYGLDGEVMTQDFPRDHYHHRGVHWTWPECRVGERKMDLWTIVGARQLFQEWVTRETGAEKATVTVQNGWFFDDDPEAKVRETVQFVVYSADEQGRAIDFDFAFANICDEHVVIRGQTDQDKGYGGFLFRPDATRRPFTFTSAQGLQKEDVLKLDTPWADISFGSGRAGAVSGAAIFQHPQNPGYPHPGWIMRHYGFLGASWPHLEGYGLEPGESVRLRYRLYLHRGAAEEADVAGKFQTYIDAVLSRK